jgi:hypothetical protein
MICNTRRISTDPRATPSKIEKRYTAPPRNRQQSVQPYYCDCAGIATVKHLMCIRSDATAEADRIKQKANRRQRQQTEISSSGNSTWSKTIIYSRRQTGYPGRDAIKYCMRVQL